MEPTLTEVHTDGLHVGNVFGLLPKQAGRCLLLGMGARKNERSRSSLCNACTDRTPSARCSDLSSDCNIVDDSSIRSTEVFVLDIEAVLSLEMTLSSLTSSVEPTLTNGSAVVLQIMIEWAVPDCLY